MNKDFLVILLQKDIKELSLLTEGFEKMSEFPKPLLQLATDKAENILNALKELGNEPLQELGAINYESFGDTLEEKREINSVVFEGKNDEGAPLDSDDEPLYTEDTEPETFEVQPEITEAEKDDFYIETEHHLDKAAGEIDIESDAPNFEKVSAGIPPAQNEEFQEEIEVEEIGENAQILPYEEPVATIQETETIQISEPEPVVEVADEKTGQNGQTLHDSLYKQDNNSLSDSLANQKIDDIRQAMNIGDRFRFQRELFSGNGEVMNKTIAYLNQLAKFEEAVSYLKSKFGWHDDNPHAEEFLQIVKRRYL